MSNFEKTVKKFQTGELNVEDWNFCTESEGELFSAYIMGDGSGQCLAFKKGFGSRKEIEDLFKSFGVKHILPGVC